MGLGLAFLASGAVGATLSMNLQDRFTPDGAAILFTFLLSTLAAILFGTVPAWKLSRVDVAALIQRPGHGRTRNRWSTSTTGRAGRTTSRTS